MRRKFVIHNGVKMTEDWPGKISSAQLLTHYTVAGQKYQRIRFGDQGHRGWGRKPCLDCGVLKGQFHVPDCEYEKCPSCGESFAGGCFCEIEELREPGEPPLQTDRVLLRARRNYRIFMVLMALFFVLLFGLIILSAFF